MAGGFAKDGGVQEQIDATLADAVSLARSRLHHENLTNECSECGLLIPKARRQAIPGVELCVACQGIVDKQNKAIEGYNRRGSKDSQLR
ncbi:DksA/TraR family C4-type zinc finger protein [Moritella sp. F3]|uniref:DksA/TraR family C4-type zinc finger protein n=1 Tax=Moritella sp. F3 TaxID=2718882 RepID=UPI0018E135B2|nr:DksA/TraR family C4-type zinc finger protein [Moritella sp. F3]GIC78855.1 hypothetical protein FMO001_35820 [Moritella sp. F1]GIC81910.1 hypothetical protein FMO003_21910 [Moritella sp. F3]